MNLAKKKELAAEALGIGKGRIRFNVQRLEDIKEAITKQDIRDLLADGAIMVKEIRGTKKVEKRTMRRREGSVRKKVNIRKREYMVLTRKARAYLEELRRKGLLKQDKFLQLRKEVKARLFKSKAQLKERIKELK